MTKNDLSYEDAMHGVQSGVAHEMNMKSQDTSPKHLRVGTNSCMVTDEAIAELLIRKGIFTEEEYIEELRVCANRELDRYEDRNAPIKFR